MEEKTFLPHQKRARLVALLIFPFSLMFFPQQPERLGVLPIKLRGGLGQPPETLHQVPRGSEGMEPVPK